MPKRELLEHQKYALDAVLKEFKQADRCHVVMACGTGKTMTALAIAESMQPKTIVVFVPSLALINQFMKEWLANISLDNFLTLAVCSDESVTKGIEEESLLYEEMLFPVCNSSLQIREFIESNINAVKIIFCTYQSAWILGEACHGAIDIDLSIFDEAHKTAGYDKGLWGYALNDDNIKIKKRLFLTATPRHANINKVNKDGNAAPIYSMDDERLYGKRAYTLSFREAINKDLICDYKIAISVAKTNLHTFNQDFKLHEQAVALKKAIDNTHSHKIITYHRSIKDAQTFSDFLQKHHLFPHTILHINGPMNMDDRCKIMDSFKNDSQAIICNSKCLTEGVDGPVVCGSLKFDQFKQFTAGCNKIVRWIEEQE